MHSFPKGSTNLSFKEVLHQGKHNMATRAREALPPAWQMMQDSSAQEKQAQAEKMPALRRRSHGGKG